MVGPTASDGPLFVAVSTTLPDVPGVIVGDDTDRTTSAERAATVAVVGDTVLLAVDGSVVVVDADAEPPEIAPGARDATTDTGMVAVLVAPTARSPLTVQVTVPEASVQPDGSVAPEAGTTRPAGSV